MKHELTMADIEERREARVQATLEKQRLVARDDALIAVLQGILSELNAIRTKGIMVEVKR